MSNTIHSGYVDTLVSLGLGHIKVARGIPGTGLLRKGLSLAKKTTNALAPVGTKRRTALKVGIPAAAAGGALYGIHKTNTPQDSPSAALRRYPSAAPTYY